MVQVSPALTTLLQGNEETYQFEMKVETSDICTHCGTQPDMIAKALRMPFTSCCLMELLPLGPPRPCHLPFEIAFSFTFLSFLVSLSQTMSMLAYLQASLVSTLMKTVLQAPQNTSRWGPHRIAGLLSVLTCCPQHLLPSQYHF